MTCISLRFMPILRGCLGGVLGGLVLLVAGCTPPAPTGPPSQQGTSVSPTGATGKTEKLFIVDCLPPLRYRKLGRNLVYPERRPPHKASAQECEELGGEYNIPPLQVWLPRAKEGDAEAQTYVGEIFEKGQSVPVDYQLAAEWYRRAAEQGFARAQINLGHLYEKGLGVERDAGQALNWYRKASGLNEAIALDTGSIRYSGLEAATQKELQELRQEVERWKRESATLRQQLEDAQQQLERARQSLQQRQSGVDAAWQQLAQAQQDLEARRQQLTAQGQTAATLQQQEAQLRQREAALAQQQQDLLQKQQDAWAQLERERQEIEQRERQIATASRNAAEVNQHRAQLEQREAELERRQQELIREQQNERQRLTQERQDLERQRQQVATTNRQIDSRAAAELKNLEMQLRQREEELTRRQQELVKLRQDVDRLEDVNHQRTAQLEALRQQRQVAMPGPTIDILDPFLVGTRGLTVVPTPMQMPERVITGRVTAPAGIQSLMVNGQRERLDEQGLFRVTVPLRQKVIPIRVLAIDQQGKQAQVEFQLTADATAPASTAAAPQAPRLEIKFGAYYALVIGNNAYKHWPSLATPENDAVKVAEILSSRYGFKTKVLLNATRYDTLQALNDLRKMLTEEDNLLIYYAGHGHWEEQIMRGYWVPVDGDVDSNVNWIPTFAITDILGAMSAKHVLVVADSCYSGALTRSAFARLEAGMTEQARLHALETMAEKRSRTVLSSGNIQPVLDAGGGRHSVFARAFLDTLSMNHDIIEGQRLWFSIRDLVAYAAQAERVEQDPQYAPLRFAGHESGDFLFVPKTVR